MAAKNEHVSCASEAWTQLTDGAGATGDVSLAVIATNGKVWIQANTTAAAPSDLDGAFPLVKVGDGFSEVTIAELFTNDASNAHLYAYAERGATIAIAHG